MASVLKNDNEEVAFKMAGQSFQVSWKSGKAVGMIEIPDAMSDPHRVERDTVWGRIAVTHDLRIRCGLYCTTDPLDHSQLREIAKKLGLRFELDNPQVRVLAVGETTALQLAGVSPLDYSSAWDIRPDEGLAYFQGGRFVYSLEDARKVATKVIADARRWIHQTLPGLVRNLELTDHDAVQLFWKARKATIIRVKVGETHEVPWAGGSYFGSGGGWGKWMIWGNVTETSGQRHDNGFCVEGTTFVTFNSPSAVYTASGDGINGGRVFYRKLFVTE
jgi:hypothetical protein